MSKKAVDAEGREHFADDFHDPYCGQYFCPNPECHTQLILKNLGLEQKAYNTRRPYFSATRNYPHVEGCPFSNTCISDENLKDVGFQPDDFFTI